MPGLFWRRRNAKLDARLNTVVETSERKKQSYKRKRPGLVIDTSFVDQQAHEADPDFQPQDLIDHAESLEGVTYQDELHAEDYASHSDAKLGFHDDEVHDAEASGADVFSTTSSTIAGSIASRAQPTADNQATKSEELELLELAIERYELAEKQEEEAKEREAAARREIEEQLARFAELEEQITQLQSSERKAQDQRDLAVQLTEESQQRVAELEAAAQSHNDTPSAGPGQAGDEAMLQDLAELESRAAALEDEVATLRQELTAANDDRDTALDLAESSETELNRLRDAAESHSESERRHADALSELQAELEPSLRAKAKLPRTINSTLMIFARNWKSSAIKPCSARPRPSRR